MSKKKDVYERSGMPIVGVVGTGRRGVAELLNALHDAKGVDFELLNEQLGTGGWYVTDGGALRALLAGVVPPEDVDGLIERAYADPSVLYDVEELFNAAAAKTKDDVADKVCTIPQADYADHVAAFAMKKVDYFLAALNVILELKSDTDADEATIDLALQERFGPVYVVEFMAALEALEETGDIGRGRKLIAAISEVSPSLFGKILERYDRRVI